MQIQSAIINTIDVLTGTEEKDIEVETAKDEGAKEGERSRRSDRTTKRRICEDYFYYDI